MQPGTQEASCGQFCAKNSVTDSRIGVLYVVRCELGIRNSRFFLKMGLSSFAAGTWDRVRRARNEPMTRTRRYSARVTEVIALSPAI